VELYGQVRRAVYVEGISQRAAARRFGIDPRTVAKVLAFSVPPGYRRSKRPTAIDDLAPQAVRYQALLAQPRVAASLRREAIGLRPMSLPVFTVCYELVTLGWRCGGGMACG
jgi:hypothetical protein